MQAYINTRTEISRLLEAHVLAEVDVEVPAVEGAVMDVASGYWQCEQGECQRQM